MLRLRPRPKGGEAHQEPEREEAAESRAGHEACERATRRRRSDFGVDTKKVRRATAPIVLPAGRGSHAMALATASCPDKLRRARRRLTKRIYAKTTRGPAKSRLRVVKRLLKKAGRQFLPITCEGMTDLVACLAEAKHRSVPSYLTAWKRRHLQAQHPWTDALTAQRKDLERAAERGQGPPKRAETFGAEKLPAVPEGSRKPIVKGGPSYPAWLVAVGVCWLLRDQELSDILGEQASVRPEALEAALDLCATKMDTKARGCERTLKCICSSGLEGPCPYHAMETLLRMRREDGWDDKDPLFPTLRGKAATSRTVVQTLRLLLRMRATGHTCRREGAQMYTRRSVPLYLTQYLGRWGGATVQIYASEALNAQMAQAASTRAAGQVPGDANLSLTNLQTTIDQLVSEAVAKRTAAFAEKERSMAPDHAVVALADSASAPGAPNPPRVRKVRGIKGQREVGEMHDAVLYDPGLPVEAWVTRCGWQFGAREHVVYEDAPTTCFWCLGGRRKAASLLPIAG